MNEIVHNVCMSLWKFDFQITLENSFVLFFVLSPQSPNSDTGRRASPRTIRLFVSLISSSSSSSSCFSAGQRLTPHSRTLEVRPGRITKKLELHYDYDVKGMIPNYYSVSQISQMYDLVLLGDRLDTVWSDTTVWYCHLIGSIYDTVNTIIPGVLVIGCMIWCFVVVLLFGCTWCVGDDASEREVSTQIRLSMSPTPTGWCIGDWLHDLMFCSCIAIWLSIMCRRWC